MKKYEIKKWEKVAILIIALITLFLVFDRLRTDIKSNKNNEIKNSINEKKMCKNIEQVEEEQQDANIEENESYEEPTSTNESYTARMTSFWSGDDCNTGSCTGSGLCEWDLGINENGWYTYNGKLVIATGTTYLADQGWWVADGIHLYQYWQELGVLIDGIQYDAIILDGCGACMRDNRIDLFVTNEASARDVMVEVIVK